MLKKQTIIYWHNKFAWFGVFTIFCWALSGITHPMMTWLGPQASKMYPPNMQFNFENTQSIKNIIYQNQIAEVKIAKLIASSSGSVFQITENNNEPRRYFDLDTHKELPGFDQQHAKWLASYYTDIDESFIQNIEFINEFNYEYPWVNRLLPVYKITFNHNNSKTSAFIYTETNALASLNDNTKALLQNIFQTLHTWNFLDITGQGRVIIIGFLILTLLFMSLTGLMMVIMLKQRRIPNKGRHWHRLFGYIIWLPLLGWSASGFYHLLQSHYVDREAGLRLGKSINLQAWTRAKQLASVNNETTSKLVKINLNAISLVEDIEGNQYYRLSLAVDKREQIPDRNHRFDGISKERNSIYINALTGEHSDLNDKKQVIDLASKFADVSVDKIENIKIVSRFGPDYDFRNKRLPVWQVNIDNEDKQIVFIDPVTSILVDQNRAIDRYETLSFSLIHKWNHLFPLIGREKRDSLIIVTLILCLFSVSIAIPIILKRRKKPGYNF